MSSGDPREPRRRVYTDEELAAQRVQAEFEAEAEKEHKRLRRKRRWRHAWQHMLYQQLLAYSVVLVLWIIPIPNPIKLLAVTFHELSHGLAAILTGGRVFGYAIAPNGGGVTLGMGGNFPTILAAGYIGSCFWGMLIYYLSVRWRPNTCLIALVGLIALSSLFGWLNEYTFVFGIGSMFLVLLSFRLRAPTKVFLIRLIGSACCLYAPLEIVSMLFGVQGSLKFRGTETPNDIHQLSISLHLHPAVIAVAILVVQAVLLVRLVRWTCGSGARAALKQEARLVRWRRRLMQELRFPQRKQSTH